MLESEERGQRQTAYQVLSASSLEHLAREQGDLWDSGKVASDQSVHVAYGGRPLGSNQSAHWKVRVWDKDGRPTVWSESATWTLGLLEQTDWHGKWITGVTNGPPSLDEALPLFRREFNLAKPVRRALVHVCGLGFYELRLNGQKVGDHELDPGWTNYRKRCLYTSYDVTEHLRPGANALGLLLGNGMYNVRGGRCHHQADWSK